MAILKSEIRNKYTTVPNSVIRAKDLSDAEYRLLMYLYSLPDGWKINQGYLGNELNCNRVNINKKIRRVKELGYLEIVKSKDDASTDYIYILKDKGVSVNDVSPSDVSLNDVSVSDTHINTNIINTDKIKKDNIKKNIKKSIPPTLEEIKKYCLERKNNIDSQKFYDYYSVSDWKDKDGKPIKNWKQKIITWESRNRNIKKEVNLEDEANRIFGTN